MTHNLLAEKLSVPLHWAFNWLQAIIVHFQRRSKILAAADLKMFARWRHCG